MKRLGCGPSWRAREFNLHGQVYGAKEEAEQYLESDKMASLIFLFSGRLPAPLETTIRGGFRVKMWAFGLDGLVPLEPLELGVRQDLAIMGWWVK